MATLWQKIQGVQSPSVRYSMIPRTLMNFIEHDIGMMANWIERTGYGANIKELKGLANELDIQITPFSKWLMEKASLQMSPNTTPKLNLRKRFEALT